MALYLCYTVVEVGGRRYCCEDCPDTDPSLSREASMAVDDDLQGPYTSPCVIRVCNV
jgi:hypothetical protein